TGMSGTVVNLLVAMNGYGTILGEGCDSYANGGCGGAHTFLWVPTSAHAATGTTTEIPRPTGITSLNPLLLNAFGQVFGTMSGPATNGAIHVFQWTPAAANTAAGTLTPIPLPALITAIQLVAMNASGQVVGELT